MRSFVLFSFATLLLYSATMGIQAMPTNPPVEGPDDCGPAASIQARELLQGILERRTPKAVSAAAVAFINQLRTNSATLTKAPVFWTGKYDRTGAKKTADILKTDTRIVGPHGGFTVFDALKDFNVDPAESANWKPETDWRAVCGAFAQYAKPTDKKAHLVYGPEWDKRHNIWADDEWPALQQNSAVTEVFTYEMNEGGKTWTDKGEIKASRRGSPVHSANTSPHGSDVE